MTRAAIALALIVLLAIPATPAPAATYRGRDIDRRTWHCHASTNDYGIFRNAEVRFDGERAYLLLPSGPRIVLILEEEIITDPHQVVGYDHKRGLRWELDVLDLGGR